MPPAIGAAVLAAAGVADATIVGTLTLSAVVGYSITTAATIGLQLGISAMTSDAKSAPQQLTVRQPLATRRRGHGRAKLGGAVAQFDTPGGVFCRAVVHCVGPVTAIREYWGADINLGLAGAGGIPLGPWSTSMRLQGFLGTDDQPASGLLSGTSGWSSAHQLKGLCYTVQAVSPLKKGSLYYPEGPPPIRIVADLVACYDPRDPTQDVNNPDTWKWSDNAALCMLEYLMHDSGFGIDPDEFDMASWAAAADDCDAAVPMRDGTTEPRFRCWNTYTYAENRSAVLARYLATCDGRIDEDAQGLVTFSVGKWVEPTVTLTERMVLGWDEYDDGREAPDAYNRMTFSYLSPAHDYQPTDGDAWDLVEAQDEAGGRIVAHDEKFEGAPSHRQARYLAKIKSAKDNPRARFTGLRTKFAGMDAYGERFVRLILPELDVDDTFEVTRCVFSPATMTLTFDLIAVGPEVYAWSTLEEGNPPALPNRGAAERPPVPSGIGYAIEQVTSGSVVTGLRARFTAADPEVDGASLFGRYRQVGDTDWRYMDGDGLEVTAEGLTSGASYQAQFAFETGAAIGDYGAVLTFVAALDTVAPDQAIGFAVTGGAGVASASWTNPGSSNLRRALLYRATGKDAPFGQAALIWAVDAAPGEPGSIADGGLRAGDYSYFLRVANGSGVGPAPLGPVNVTVT